MTPNTFDFPPLSSSTSSQTRPYHHGGPSSNSRAGSQSRNWWGPPKSGPNPYGVTHVVEKFDELEVIEDKPFEQNPKSKTIKNKNNERRGGDGGGGGLNFDAYEEIPVEASGENVPNPVKTFGEIDLGECLNKNIRRCKYVKPTPIQRHAIPIAMAGRDLMACAQTGSGKTAAFCFPIIAGILRRDRGSIPPFRSCGGGMASPVALILSPTRELASQINDEAVKFAYQTGVKVVAVYGGSPMFNQLRKLEKGVDILVATPGRLVDMVERGKVSLRMIRYLALDEADRMLDMGFEPQIRKIVQQSDMPPSGKRQTLLFSATFPTEIQRLASDFLSNYIFLTVGRVGSSTDLIVQKVEFVYDADKKKHLKDLLSMERNGTQGKRQALTIVFVETKRGVDELESWLSRNGFPATAIHGDKMQMERERALRSFKTGTRPIMVATDVAARGLDIPCVAHVINFDLPRDIDDYVHRIGRTGRAGNSGVATAFFNEKNLPIAKALVELMVEANQEVPPWLKEYAETFSSYGGGRRYRGNKFGGRDYRSFDQPAGYSDFSSSRSGEDSTAFDFNIDSSCTVAQPRDMPAYDEVPTAFGFGKNRNPPVAAPDLYDSAAYGCTHGFGKNQDPPVTAPDSCDSPAYGYTNGYESIVATGWD